MRGILAALLKRIETGSAVKAGWFELSELKPEPPEQQRARAEKELAEVNAGREKKPSNIEQPLETIDQVLVVEDLALRALQADLGVSLNRHISAGPDAGFDAAFAKDGKLNIVEVKFFTESTTAPNVRASLDRIAKAVERVHWRNVRIVLVLVFRKHEDVYLAKDPLLKVLEGFPLPAELRTYSLEELNARFGTAQA